MLANPLDESTWNSSNSKYIRPRWTFYGMGFPNEKDFEINLRKIGLRLDKRLFIRITSPNDIFINK